MVRGGRGGQVRQGLGIDRIPSVALLLFYDLVRPEGIAGEFFQVIVAGSVLEEAVAVHWIIAVHSGNGKEREPGNDQETRTALCQKISQIIYSIHLMVAAEQMSSSSVGHDHPGSGALKRKASRG